MGKSKHKDRCRKEFRISEEEDRRKIRESILKIFRDRAQSPSGAVLVHDRVTGRSSESSKARSLNETKSSQLQRNQKLMEDSSSSESLQDSQHETRKRKRRKRIVTGKESGKHDHKTTVTQHVKSARTHSFKESENRRESISSHGLYSDGHITHDRLTRAVGLFNPGKKSKPVYKEPPAAPESVEREVEETLKQILSKDNDAEIWSHNHTDASATDSCSRTEGERRESHDKTSFLPQRSVHNDHSTKRSVSSLGSSPTRPESATLQSSGVCAAELDKPFPKMVPKEEIATSMLSFLHTESKNVLKDRDLFSETCEELNNLLRQNQSTSEMSSIKRKLCVRESTGTGSVQPSPLDSCSGVHPGVSSTDTGQRRPHSVEICVHRGHLSSLDSAKHCWSAEHPAHHSQAVSRSLHSRSSTQPSHFDCGRQSVVPSGGSRRVTDLSALSLPPTSESQLTFNSDSLTLPCQPCQAQQQMVFASRRRGDGLNPVMPCTIGPYQQQLNLFPREEQSELRERSEILNETVNRNASFEKPLNLFPQKEGRLALRERNGERRKNGVRRGDDCSMELDPQIVDGSKDLMLNQSAIQLLQCNHFISRVSSLCGEAKVSPEVDVPPVSLHNFVHAPSSAASVSCRGDCSASVEDTAPALERRGSVERSLERDLFWGKVMGQSAVQPWYEQKLEPSGHRPPQAEAQDYLQSLLSTSDTGFGSLPREHSESAGTHMDTGHVSRSTKIRSDPDALDASVAFSNDFQSDLLDQLDFFAKHGFQHYDWRPHQPFGDQKMDTNCVHDHGHWRCSWNHSCDILPPLRKPSLNTPSPPQKLSPHKWY